MTISATNSLRLPASPAGRLAALAALLWAGPASGTDVYVRNLGDNGQCLIAPPGASNSTPVQITCQAPHNFAVGDTIQIANVAGNTAANDVRKVKTVPSPTTFTITDLNGVNVAGNGVWSRGDQPGGPWIGGVQRAGRVTARTLKDHPRLLLDAEGWTLLQFAASVENGLLASIQVSGGTATATYTRAHELVSGQTICVYGATATALNCATATASRTITAVPTPTTIQFAAAGVPNGTYATPITTVSAWAQGGNPAWEGVQANRALMDNYYQVPAMDAVRERSLNFALICYVNRHDTNACHIAKWAVTHAEDMAVNFGLDETQNYGGDPNVDYIAFKLFSMAQIYTLMRAQLTPAERAAFASKMLNDLNDPVLGGNCEKLLRIDKPGTIVKAGDFLSELTINGTGTSFLTDLQPGMVILPPVGTLMYDSQSVYVTEVTSDTVAKGVGIAWNGPYSVIPLRSANSCGAVWFSKHHPSGPFAHPLLYPPQGGTSIYGVAPLSNITITKTWAYLAMGLALADDDPRAQTLVADMILYFMDNTWPVLRNQWTGFSGSGSNYHYARVSYMIADVINMIRYSIRAAPDLTGGRYLKNMGAHLRFIWAPNSVGTDEGRLGIWAWGADGAPDIFAWSGGRPAGLSAAMTITRDDPETHKAYYWLRNVFTTFDGVTIGTSSGYYSAGVFLRIPPTLAQVDYRSGPTQRIFRGVDQAVCLAQGSVPCPAEGGFNIIISRTGWTDPNDTGIGYEGADYWADHSVQRAGDYVVYKGFWLLAGDSWGGSQQAGVPEYHRSNLYQISGLQIARGEVSANYGNIIAEPYDSRIPRWAGGDNDEGVAASEYAYWLNDLTRTYVGNNLRRLHRHVAHLKKPGTVEHLVLYDDAATEIDSSFHFYTHYAQNGQPGEGTTQCLNDCAALDTDREMRSQTAGASPGTVTTRFLALPDVPARVFVNNPDGTFPGGLGRSFRVSSCAASGGACATNARNYEMVTVHRLATGTPAPVNVTTLNPDASWTGVQLPGQTALFARKGALIRGLPPTTLTHSGSSSLLVAGLSAGTYRLQLNGAPVAGCDGEVAVGANDSTFYCGAVGPGSVQLVPTSTPHSGRTGNTGRLGGTAGLP